WRGDVEIADEAQEIRALEPESASSVRAIPAHLMKGGLDETPLELRNRAVIARAAAATRIERARRRDRRHASGAEQPRCHADPRATASRFPHGAGGKSLA